MTEGQEFIYILINRSLPGLVKIGRTDRTVEERVRELSAHTGVPTVFTIFREFRVNDSVSAEGEVHRRLKDFRLAENREFFSIEPEVAVEVVEEIVGRGSARVYDPDAEDELLARATTIAVEHGKVWPSLLSSSLTIAHAEAERLMTILRGRGMIDDSGRHAAGARTRCGFSNASTSGQGMPGAKRQAVEGNGEYSFPSLALLPKPASPLISEEEHRQNAESLLRILADHEMDVCLAEINVGPVLARHEFTQNSAIRLERLPALEAAVTSSLGVTGARVLPPTLTRPFIGIEVPNRTPSPVTMRALLESEQWNSARAFLPIAFGADVCGKPVIRDLAKDSHILIAGARGSGRTSIVNAMLASMLYYGSPIHLRLVMIDPTARDLRPFNTLPHMLLPVISDPSNAPAAFRWLLAEMEQRFQVFALVGSKDIRAFNSRGTAADVDRPKAELEVPSRLPHIVVVLSELADLFLTKPSEMETLLTRLAENGGAAGIHIIAATQRPTSDVLTEAFRSALPLHIALKVGSRFDSQTLLGVTGAEGLIGRGDMLMRMAGSPHVVRAQVAAVGVDEIENICEFIRQNGPPQYVGPMQRYVDSQAIGGDSGIDQVDPPDGLEEDEELFHQAIEVLKSTRRATAGMLQRRLRIGYLQASHLMDRMCEKGIVGPENGSLPREILVDLDSC